VFWIYTPCNMAVGDSSNTTRR